MACANAWAAAIAEGAGAEPWLVGLVLRLRAVLRARPFTATPASEVGAALVDGQLTDPDVLARTAEVLDSHLYALAGCDDTDARTRLTLVLGSLAAGFAGALQRCVVAEQRHMNMRLRHQAHHDPLTGLPNRALLAERIKQMFRSPPADSRVGLCFLDLDEFKRVNDVYGHDFGDQLLAAVAERMNDCVTSHGHLLARMGGDEFVILVTHARPGAAATIADQVTGALAAPFRLGEHEVRVSASIGVVERPLAATGPAELLRAADVTMYRAKKAGKGRWTMFDQDRGPHRLDFPVQGGEIGCLGLGAAIAS
jgi:diguanylate cyclase (GGDEF)-like protein